jgi:hypothetical protein
MASIGHGDYGVIVLHVGDPKASYIKLVLQREPRTSKTRFHIGSILPNEAHIDAAVSDLFEETGLNFTVDDLTVLSGNLVRVPLHVGQYQLVHFIRRWFLSRT